MSARLGQRPAIDGLRAVAVLLVLGFHAGLVGMAGGRAGVDVFFVVSGFLITALLLEEHARTGGIKLRDFYMRRVLRLYPALIVAVVGAVMLAALTMPVFDAGATALKSTVTGAFFTLAYVMNLARAADWSGGGYLGHAWSLAIEEQFYLLWPVVVIAILRRGGNPATLGWIAAGCAATSAVLRASLDAAGVDGQLLFNATFSHVDGIFAGCALGVAWSMGSPGIRRAGHPVAATIAIIVAALVIVRGHDMNTYGFAVVVVATLVVLANLLNLPDGALSNLLSRPVLTAVGKRSYGLYLFHWPIFLFIGIDTRPAILALGFGLSFGAAWISYALVERPFLRMKARWTTRDDRAGVPQSPRTGGS